MIPALLWALACGKESSDSLIAEIYAAHVSGNDFLGIEETRRIKEEPRFQDEKVYELVDAFVAALADDDLSADETGNLVERMDALDASGKMRADFENLDWHHAWTRTTLGRFDDSWNPVSGDGAPDMDEECEIFRLLSSRVDFKGIDWNEKIKLAEPIEGNVIAEYAEKPTSAALAIRFYAQIEPDRKSVPRTFVEILQNADTLSEDLVNAVKDWARDTQNPVVTGELLRLVDEYRIAGKVPSHELSLAAFSRSKNDDEWQLARSVVVLFSNSGMRPQVQAVFEEAILVRSFAEQKEIVSLLTKGETWPFFSEDFNAKFEIARSREKVTELIGQINGLHEDYARNPKAHAGESFAELKKLILEFATDIEVQESLQALLAVKPDFNSVEEILLRASVLSGSEILKDPMLPQIKAQAHAAKDRIAFVVLTKIALANGVDEDIDSLKSKADALEIYITPELEADLALADPTLKTEYWIWFVNERSAAAVKVMAGTANTPVRNNLLGPVFKKEL